MRHLGTHGSCPGGAGSYPNNNTEKLILPAVEDSKQLDNTELDKLWMNMEFHTSSRMAPVEEILLQNYHLLTSHSKLY